MLTRCIFIEILEETVGRDGNWFLMSLGTQPEDESQNNVSRDKAVQYVRNDWERFCPFVALHIKKINVQLHIHERDDYKMWASMVVNRFCGG
jgi:hypothetical protein